MGTPRSAISMDQQPTIDSEALTNETMHRTSERIERIERSKGERLGESDIG
jgi:hypothetical protein